jgi:hypothetical protein
MFFNRIRERQSGVLLYGITPPKAVATPEKVCEAADKVISTLCSQDIDALVVYDVQDESARTNEERPFPFSSSLDPFEYSSRHLQGLKVPKIIYRPAGNYTIAELKEWLNGLRTHGFFPIFVGLPSPDYVVKTTLPEAYAIWREHHADASVIGAVTIPERHAQLGDEDTRILDKVACGVSFFISQCIFNVDYTQKMIDALAQSCVRRGQPIPTLIFTLTICGSPKTLDFMEWLGIHMPDDIKQELKASTNALARSVEIATDIARDLIAFCKERSVPFGFNIESVATRRVEIDASLELLGTVSRLLTENGLRNAHVSQSPALTPSVAKG